MKKIRIAFYKGEGSFADRVIRWWTDSKYSHCEIIMDDLWYTSSYMDGGVVCRKINHNEGSWDFFDFEVTDTQHKKIKSFFETRIGKGYDFLGIFLSQIVDLGIHESNKWFCSEICHRALIEVKFFETYWFNYRSSNTVSPQKLYEMILMEDNFEKKNISH